MSKKLVVTLSEDAHARIVAAAAVAEMPTATWIRWFVLQHLAEKEKNERREADARAEFESRAAARAFRAAGGNRKYKWMGKECSKEYHDQEKAKADARDAALKKELAGLPATPPQQPNED